MSEGLGALAARLVPMIAEGATAAGAALPFIFIPTNNESDTIDLGDGLRVNMGRGQYYVDIERRANNGVFGWGARWERLPVDAHVEIGPDHRRSVIIDNRQLEDAVGPDAAVRAWDAIGSAMARPRRPKGKEDDNAPPAGIGHNSGEGPDPETGGRPPPVLPPSSSSSEQESEKAADADPTYRQVARQYRLAENSETTRQLIENLDTPVETFIGKHREGRIRRVFPTEYLQGTVRDVLESGDAKAIKLLKDGRFKR